MITSFDNFNPEVGNYVFVKPGAYANQIGKIVKIDLRREDWTSLYYVKFMSHKGTPKFLRHEILCVAKTIPELEMFLQAQKYNL